MLTIVAATGEMSSLAFLRKLEAALRDQGQAHQFWGWSRYEGSSATPGVTILLTGGGEANRSLRWRYLLWMWRVFCRAKRTPPGGTWFCDGLASALPVILAARSRGDRVVFFNMDNYSMAYSWPAPLRLIVAGVERFTVRRATLHVVPGQERWPHSDENLRIVKNSPSTGLIRAAQAIAAARHYEPTSPFTLYVNGWLTETRGLNVVLEVARHLDPVRFRVLVAGNPLCEAATQLLQLPIVENLGQLSGEEALATYARAHLCVALYDPTIPINRIAEPNKWQDCLVFGTPFLTNAEVVTSKAYVDAGACVSVPYGDTGAMLDWVNRLADEPERWASMRVALRQFPIVPWDEALDTVMTDFGLIPNGRTAVPAQARSHCLSNVS